MKIGWIAAVVVAGIGCRTEFIGDPHVAPGQCQAKCASTGMRMTGMVYMGEYSSACICELAPPPGAPMPPPPAGGPPGGAPQSGAGAAAAGAAAGVVMQMRREEEQRKQYGRP
jgi:hypothetical protein